MFYGARVFIIIGFLIVLSGCGTLKPRIDASKLSCPETGFLHEAEEMSILDADGIELTHIKLDNFSGSCSVSKKGELAVKVDAKLYFYAERNPDAAVTEKQDFDYFVTIISPTGKILAKEVFSTRVELDEEFGVGAIEEEVEQIIPLARLEQAGLYKIIFGLQLTKDQFNKRKN